MSRSNPTVYLAGPSLFFADWRERAAKMRALCAARGAHGLYPADVDITPSDDPFQTGLRIFEKDRDLIERADAVVADLTPFRGTSADVGTVWEMGYACGRGKPVAAYSLERRLLHERVTEDEARVERFNMADNLMLPGANVAANPAAASVLAQIGGVFTTFVDALDCVLERLRDD